MKKTFLYTLILLHIAFTTYLAFEVLDKQNTTTDFSNQVLTVKGIVVVDSAGTDRVIIGAHLPDPMILGKRLPRGGAGTAGILLQDHEGNERSGYITTDDTYSNVMLTLDEVGNQNALFMTEPIGATALWFWAENGNQVMYTVSEDTTQVVKKSNGKDLN